MADLPEFCRQCGTELERRQIEGRERAYCGNCEEPRYRNPKPCAGVLVVDGDELLLVQRDTAPAVGSWSVPAGFLEVDESPEEAAVRELQEETGLSVPAAELSLFETTLVTHADGRTVLVIVYRAVRAATSGSVSAGSDAAGAGFWDVDALIESGESLERGYESIFRRAVAADPSGQ